MAIGGPRQKPRQMFLALQFPAWAVLSIAMFILIYLHSYISRSILVYLAPSRGHIGPSGCQIGAFNSNIGPSGSHIGPFGGLIGSSSDHIGLSSGPVRPSSSHIEPSRDNFGPSRG